MASGPRPVTMKDRKIIPARPLWHPDCAAISTTWPAFRPAPARLHQEDAAQGRDHRTNPIEQFALIGVGAQLVQTRNFRAYPHRLAENAHFRPFLDQLPAQGVLRHEAGIST